MEKKYKDLAGLSFNQVQQLKAQYKKLERKENATPRQRQAHLYTKDLYNRRKKELSQREDKSQREERRKNQKPLETYHDQETMNQDYPELAGLSFHDVRELKAQYESLAYRKKTKDASPEQKQANLYTKYLYLKRRDMEIGGK